MLRKFCSWNKPKSFGALASEIGNIFDTDATQEYADANYKIPDILSVKTHLPIFHTNANMKHKLMKMITTLVTHICVHLRAHNLHM